jgi:hypothetical protein
MNLFSSLFSKNPPPNLAAATKSPGRPVTFDVPAALPKLILPEAMETKGEEIAPAAHLSSLLEQQKATESVEFLAASLPEEDAIRWASESCALVAPKLTPNDQAALDCCNAWLAEPTATNGKLAGAAAARADYSGPGAWAAQAAAWAETTGFSARMMSPLIAKAVTGSIMLAAVLAKPGASLPPAKPAVRLNEGAAASDDAAVDRVAPAPPGAAAATAAAGGISPVELCRTYKPFLDKGIAIAAG